MWDHGKSTLIHALTSIDPDRLPEEKEREMTIDLGFAWMETPSGREVSIVDVPGHERFIKNMLAGVGGIDLAMLIVAANESVMRQTREHPRHTRPAGNQAGHGRHHQRGSSGRGDGRTGESRGGKTFWTQPPSAVPPWWLCPPTPERASTRSRPPSTPCWTRRSHGPT